MKEKQMTTTNGKQNSLCIRMKNGHDEIITEYKK